MTMRKSDHRQETNKSNVRGRVTYLMSVTYAVSAVTLMVWLMLRSEHGLALGVFSGVASTTATITAFWFGYRASTQSPPYKNRRVSQE